MLNLCFFSRESSSSFSKLTIIENQLGMQYLDLSYAQNLLWSQTLLPWAQELQKINVKTFHNNIWKREQEHEVCKQVHKWDYIQYIIW
jgi:hypothetical protein